MKTPFLFVALDGLDYRTAYERVSELSDEVKGSFGFKVNLDYLLDHGLRNDQLISWIQRLEKVVFTDLKMFNGTRTMTSVIEILVGMKVNFLNVYALADNLLPKAIEIAKGTKTKILGLTVLTHFNEDYCQKHFRRSLLETVRHFAEVAIDAGCDGIILPGTALDIVKDLKILKVVPGIRPKWYKDTRHSEEVEPKVAIEKGADMLVCGSPILKSPNRIKALQDILFEIK